MPADTRYKKQYQVSSSKYHDALEACLPIGRQDAIAKRTFLFLCVSAPLREKNPPRRIGKQEISEGPFYSFVSCLQLAGSAPLREKKSLNPPKFGALFFSPTYLGFQESRVGPEYPNSTFL